MRLDRLEEFLYVAACKHAVGFLATASLKARRQAAGIDIALDGLAIHGKQRSKLRHVDYDERSKVCFQGWWQRSH
ncbi:hypothetical protein A1D31_39655 [Bradyrhizobium liaoningense]|nr:hypothetical protein A1D31_39655 [Bradyrhizobium liaoningense]